MALDRHNSGRVLAAYWLSGNTFGEGWLEWFLIKYLIGSPVVMYWKAQWLSIGNMGDSPLGE